jgi:hypothetical protein
MGDTTIAIRDLTAAERFALDSLAAQITHVEQQRAALQKALDEVIEGMGLNPEGEYSINPPTEGGGEFGSISAKSLEGLNIPDLNEQRKKSG